MKDLDSDRRTFLKAGGAALTVGLAGCIGPFQDTEGVPGTVEPTEPDENGDGGGNGGSRVEQYLSDANEFDGIVDRTGEDEVTIQVGGGEGLAFDPAAVQIDPGTTVTWEWTGEGGQHNVVHEGGDFESDLTQEAGHTFTQDFDEDATYLYFCNPHKELGMRGTIIVGDGGETGTGGGGDGGAEAEVEEYLSDANQYDGIEDMTGQGEVTVQVGGGDGLAFDPPAIEVDPGTTVTWEWTGEGGQHNVVHEGGNFESDLTQEAGHTFEHEFGESGVFLYFCQPHKALGMRGAVVVGDGGSGDSDGGDSDGEAEAEVEEYLSDANEYDGIDDMTGQGDVMVQVGGGEGLAFDPPAIRVDSGTTVTWEWTGEGGQHNVVHQDGAFESDLKQEAGNTFEFEFGESGVFLYFCQPHEALGMKGAVVVE